MRFEFKWNAERSELALAITNVGGQEFLIGLSDYANALSAMHDFYGDVKYTATGYELVNIDDEGKFTTLLITPHEEIGFSNLTIDQDGDSNGPDSWLPNKKVADFKVETEAIVAAYETAFESFLESKDYGDLTDEELESDKYFQIKEIENEDGEEV